MSNMPPSIINNRYEVLNVLGQGGNGITYQARDQGSGQDVALKELSLKELSDWKKLELFKREAEVLKKLDHPSIPKYVDYFEVDTDSDRNFYIVQEIARGQSLAELVATGQRFSEADAKQIAIEILQVLQYLQSLNPPIIHRDIKPQNIIQRDDGSIALVDFGAVQTVHQNTVAFHSTIVGTYGYMAPEQFSGQASPLTDLYGLGATLINLLSHKHPGDLSQARLKLNFRPATNVSEEFAKWLDGLIEPLIEDRFDSAGTALAALSNSSSSIRTLKQLKKPAGSCVQLKHDPQRLSLLIPPRNLPFAVAWLVLIKLLLVGLHIFWIIDVVNSGVAFAYVFLPLPLWFLWIWVTITVLNISARHTLFEINKTTFTLKRQIGFWKTKTTGKTADLHKVLLKNSFIRNVVPLKTMILSEHRYGESFIQTLLLELQAKGDIYHQLGAPLTSVETDWLLPELNDFISKQKQ